MTLLNPTPPNHHAVVFAAADQTLHAAHLEHGIGSTTETPAGKHYTDITFDRSSLAATQPVLDALRAALEPLDYKAFRMGIGASIIRVMHPRPNWMVVIGYQGNKRGYINVPEDEARRRWLASENECAPPDCLKTEVDEPVKTIRFHDEINLY